MNQLAPPRGVRLPGLRGRPLRALTREEVEAHLASAPAREDRLAAERRAVRAWHLWFSGACLAAALGSLGVAAAALARREDRPPQFLPVDAATLRPLQAIRALDMPQRLGDAHAKADLARLAEWCETYNPEEAADRTHRCALMLAPDTQEQYRRWWNCRGEGCTSPRATLGDHGRATIQRDSMGFSDEGEVGGLRVWTVRFNRIEVERRQPGGQGSARCAPWMMVVRFRWHPELKMSEADRLHNVLGFQAYGLTSQRDPGARPCSP